MYFKKTHSSKITVALNIVILLLVQSCKLADLRTSQINDSQPNQEQKAIDLLDQVISNQGLKILAQSETYSVTAVDNWKGLMTLMNPLPKDNKPMVLRYRPMSFDGQFNYVASKHKTIYGTQSLQSYEMDEFGKVTFRNKEKITFSLAAIQYFIELPLRLRNAPILKYAGVKEFEGKTYDLVFATWDQFQPHQEHDQYILYIDREDGLLAYVNYTIRGMYLPMPKNIYGSLRMEDYQKSKDGILHPTYLYVQLNQLKKK
ncbi:MAG: hypothetical protein AAFQ94_21735, partial [Bacteroidota bacterium]